MEVVGLDANVYTKYYSHLGFPIGSLFVCRGGVGFLSPSHPEKSAPRSREAALVHPCEHAMKAFVRLIRVLVDFAPVGARWRVRTSESV